MSKSLYPPGYEQALKAARSWPDPVKRIDEITDQLVNIGACRPRYEFDGRLLSEAERRDLMMQVEARR